RISRKSGPFLEGSGVERMSHSPTLSSDSFIGSDLPVPLRTSWIVSQSSSSDHSANACKCPAALKAKRISLLVIGRRSGHRSSTKAVRRPAPHGIEIAEALTANHRFDAPASIGLTL